MKKQTALIATLALALTTTLAFAGLKSTTGDVTVNKTSRTAFGSLGTARNSFNNTEYIDCRITATTTGTYIACTATNAAGIYASCILSNPTQQWLSALYSMSGDSNVFFRWDTLGKCTEITVINGSQMEPKLHNPPSSFPTATF